MSLNTVPPIEAERIHHEAERRLQKQINDHRQRHPRVRYTRAHRTVEGRMESVSPGGRYLTVRKDTGQAVKVLMTGRFDLERVAT